MLHTHIQGSPQTSVLHCIVPVDAYQHSHLSADHPMCCSEHGVARPPTLVTTEPFLHCVTEKN